MNKRYFSLFLIGAVFFIILFPGLSHADIIVLQNGEKLIGTIERLEMDTVTLVTGYSEPIKIQSAMIARIFTDSPVEVQMIDGQILKGLLKTTEDGNIVIDSSEGRAATSVDWSRIKAINPPSPQPKKWDGSITIGAAMQSGNTDRASASVSAQAVRKTDKDRFSLRFRHNYAEEDDELTTRNTFGALKYDYFFTRAMYGYLGVELLNDKFKDLNLRVVVGPGVGYQIWDDEIKTLLVEAGLAYFSEDLDKGDDDSWITARLAGDFSYKLLDTIIFTDNLVVYPNLEDSGEYQLRNEAAIISALSENWALRLSNIVEYDSDPPQDIKKTDLYWILALQYSF